MTANRRQKWKHSTPDRDVVASAVEGWDYCKVQRTDKRGKGLVFKCLLAYCPQKRLTYVRKDQFNQHMMEHPPNFRRWIYDCLPLGQRGNRGSRIGTRITSENERAFHIKNRSGFFPWRWKKYKSQKLKQLKDGLVKTIMEDCLREARTPVGHPGPLPTLLMALQVTSPYLPDWKTLQHSIYASWLVRHIDNLLGVDLQTHFVVWLRVAQAKVNKKIQEMNDIKPRARRQQTCTDILYDQLQAIETIMRSVLTESPGEELANFVANLREDAVGYITKAAPYYAMQDFIANQEEAVHSRIVVMFDAWRRSEAGFLKKKAEGVCGFIYRRERADEGSIVEEDTESFDLGCFEDAEKDTSDSENVKDSPSYPRFEFFDEAEQYVRRKPKKAAILMPFVKKVTGAATVKDHRQRFDGIPDYVTVPFTKLDLLKTLELRLQDWCRETSYK